MSRETVIGLARKWYKIIGFPEKFDSLFEELAEKEQDLETMDFSDYDLTNNSQKGKKFIMFLYFCEQLSNEYKEKNIAYEIFLETVRAIITSTEYEFALSGNLGIVKADVLKPHFEMRLFKIGRLQFCMDKAPREIPEKGIKAGENVIDVHIPPGDTLSIDECKIAFSEAEKFFGKYFPKFDYRYYTCFSWMLDKNLKNFLNEKSNILKFQKFFEPVYEWEYDSILHFVFKYGIKSREELKSICATSSFAEKIKECALSGGKFYNTLGVRERKFIGKERENENS